MTDGIGCRRAAAMRPVGPARLLVLFVVFALAFALPLTVARGDGQPPAPNGDTQPDDLSSSHRDIDAAKIERAPPGQEWWREMVQRFPACAVLTDGCQSCVNAGDTITCSNPGIACLRGEWRCAKSGAENQKNPPQIPSDDSSKQDMPPNDARPAKP
jgi:hypothetical protein